MVLTFSMLESFARVDVVVNFVSVVVITTTQ